MKVYLIIQGYNYEGSWVHDIYLNKETRDKEYEELDNKFRNHISKYVEKEDWVVNES